MDNWKRKFYLRDLSTRPSQITLLRELPGKHLKDTIIPAVQDLVKQTSPYPVVAGSVRDLNRGSGIGINLHHLSKQMTHETSGKPTSVLYKALQNRFWKFLRDWDRSAFPNTNWNITHKHPPAVMEQARSELQQWLESGRHWSRRPTGKDIIINQIATAKVPTKRGFVLRLIVWKESAGDWTEPQFFPFMGKFTIGSSDIRLRMLREVGLEYDTVVQTAQDFMRGAAADWSQSLPRSDADVPTPSESADRTEERRLHPQPDAISTSSILARGTTKRQQPPQPDTGVAFPLGSTTEAVAAHPSAERHASWEAHVYVPE